MPANKNHHKIPRTYLQSFSDDNGFIWIADNMGNLYRQKPVAALRESDYFTVRFKDGSKSLIIETRVLGGIETAYGQILSNKILSGQELTPEERATMSIFMASMLERSPARRRAEEEFNDQLRSMLDHMEGLPEHVKKNASSLPLSRSENAIPARDFLESREDVGSYHSATLPQKIEISAPVINEMTWTFYENRNPLIPFLASDCPCVLFNRDLPKKSFYQPALMQENVEVSLPLSPKLAVVARWGDGNDKKELASEEHARELNKRTIKYASTLISRYKQQLEPMAKQLRVSLSSENSSK